MIENADWQAILATATDISTVAEFYPSDAVPDFDPNDALNCYATVAGISYMGVDYTQLISEIGGVKRSTGKESNTGSVTFSNVSREIADFELNGVGFEGLVMVIRVISRSLSDSLDKSQILFAGRCEKPTSGSKESLQVTAAWILGGPEIQIPYRKFTPTDDKGRVPSDPDFEGFPDLPQEGEIAYSTREKRGGLLGLFGLKKTVIKTLAWSSHSDADASKSVPEVLGESQLEFTHVGYADIGTFIKIRSVACQGPIYDLQNVRSLDSRLPLSTTAYAENHGLRGASNGPDDPSWVAPGLYSRSAYIRGGADNSLVSEDDPAPRVVGTIFGRLMTIPTSGAWTNTDQWSDNPAAHARWALTSDDYYDIPEDWLDDDDFSDSYDVCNELIVRQSATDLLTLVQG